MRPYCVPRAIPELSTQPSEHSACPLDLILYWVETRAWKTEHKGEGWESQERCWGYRLKWGDSKVS